MANMRAMMPALQKAKAVQLASGIAFANVQLPAQTRETRIVKDVPAGEIARELKAWMEE
jgi:electron transfer flavoprotein beta subunit